MDTGKLQLAEGSLEVEWVRSEVRHVSSPHLSLPFNTPWSGQTGKLSPGTTVEHPYSFHFFHLIVHK